jgi:hypothetical protein
MKLLILVIRQLSLMCDTTGGIGSKEHGKRLTELPYQACSKETLDSRVSELTYSMEQSPS